MIEREMPYLKELFIDTITTSDNFPFLTWLDFVNVTTKGQFIDEKVKSATIDLLFVTVSSYNKSSLGICRGEFIELIIRIARAKYLETGKVKKISEAFKMLLET